MEPGRCPEESRRRVGSPRGNVIHRTGILCMVQVTSPHKHEEAKVSCETVWNGDETIPADPEVLLRKVGTGEMEVC